MLLTFALLIAGGLFMPSFTYAQTGTGEKLENENLYLFAEQVTLTSPAPKDVMIFAGDVIINALINGDLQIAARSVEINAPILGDVRIAAGEIHIKSSHVGEDLLLTGGSIVVDDGATSSGHTMIFSANTIFNGSSEKSLEIKTSDLTLGGVQNGNVVVESSILKLGDTFKVKKDFSYAANSQVEVKPGTVEGKIQKNEVQGTEITTWDRVMNALSIFISLFLALTLCSWFFPGILLRQVEIMKTQTLSSFVKGFLGGILIPVLFLILVFTVVGFPLIIALFFLYLAAVCISPLLAAMYLGTLLLTKDTTDRHYVLLIALAGSLVTTLILQIPVIGMLIMILISAVALGSFMKVKE